MSMPKTYFTLFHGTTPDSAMKITKEGFSLGEDKCIWFTTDFQDAMNFALNAIVETVIYAPHLEDMGCELIEQEQSVNFDKPEIKKYFRVRCCSWDKDMPERTRTWLLGKETKWGQAQAYRNEELLKQVLLEIIRELKD